MVNAYSMITVAFSSQNPRCKIYQFGFLQTELFVIQLAADRQQLATSCVAKLRDKFKGSLFLTHNVEEPFADFVLILAFCCLSCFSVFTH